MTRRISIVLTLALCLGACERPFVDIRPPDIEIIEPNPDEVVPDASTLLRVRATSFRGVGRVTINGVDADKDGTETWSRSIKLNRGMNEVVVEAFDPEEVPTIDTLRLFRLSVVRLAGPEWQTATGGHTATPLGDGQLLLSGGSLRPGGPATDASWILNIQIGTIAPGPRLIHARTGHTATLLPDGRVVVFGGSVTDSPASVADLVESVEILDPDLEMFRELTVSGDPVRRAFHTASLRSTADGPVVDLLGGTGDIRYGDAPRLDVRSDLRSFRVSTDSALALVPWFGVYVDALTNHSQTALHAEPAGSLNEFLLSGTVGGRAAEFPVNYVMDTRSSPSIFLEPFAPPEPSRTDHGAARIGDGQVLLFGGTTREQEMVASGAVFDYRIGRFLFVPEHALGTPTPRYRHTATLLSDGRILIMGGFHAGGAAETMSDLFLY